MASDNHADGRTLMIARNWLTDVGETGQADLLTHENPARLLGDRELLPVPPLARRRGMMGRLRELVGLGRDERKNS
jgi:hypothetical protein